MKLPDFTTGWCAADCSATDIYNAVDCGPIRSNVIDAIVDRISGNYENIRYVDREGLLYAAKPLSEIKSPLAICPALRDPIPPSKRTDVADRTRAPWRR
jgi:hypothetical protein